MYRLLRNTHLILGLFLFWMILMYGVSAIQMAHQIRITPTVAESDITAPAGLEARALATHLMANQALAGEMGKSNPTPAGYQFAIIRAGGQTQVRYESSTGKIHLRSTDTGIWGTLNRLHHFHGLHNQTGARNAWGWTVLFTSLAMFALGATGLYMWFKLHQQRTLGFFLLSANAIVSILLLAVLRGYSS